MKTPSDNSISSVRAAILARTEEVGPALRQALTAAYDQWLAGLLPPGLSGVALIAVGGLGRGEPTRAMTQGKIADILQARGEYDEALRIRREEQLPVYERLGDVRSRAVAQGKIADILQAQGEYDEALRIRREEELPVYERLGDVRSRAVAQGKIADILQSRGEYDEALRIRREEELPVHERLGDVRGLLVGRTNLALSYLRRGKPEDRPTAAALLRLALTAAEGLRIPEAQQIHAIIQRYNLPDEP